MVRVTTRTHERLKAEQRRLLERRARGGFEPAELAEWRDAGPWISLEGVIARLLDHLGDHHKRSKSSKAKGRQSQKKGGGQ